jgi:hypothetical protein
MDSSAPQLYQESSFLQILGETIVDNVIGFLGDFGFGLGATRT